MKLKIKQLNLLWKQVECLVLLIFELVVVLKSK